MGMYTELVLSFELKKDTPLKIIDTLSYMINGEYKFSMDKLDNDFLNKANRLKYMLHLSSYYFAYPESLSEIIYNDITRTHHVSIRCSLKNYENEIDCFLIWIAPYIYNERRHTFLGYSLYEENNKPKLIYLEDYLK